MLVRVGEGARDLPRDRQRVVQRQLGFMVEALPQGLSLDVRHDVIQQVGSGARVIQRQDVGMVELCGDLDLSQEPFCAERGGDLLAEYLDGDDTVMARVVGQKHHRHAAAAELPLERVAARQGDPEALLKLEHRR